MDYKVVSVLALVIVSVIGLPYQPPHPASLDFVEVSNQQQFPDHADLIKPPRRGPPAGVDHGAPKCPCAKIYFPLCASDGNSYNNMCEFSCQARHVRKLYGTNIHVVKETRCDETE